MFLSMCVKSEGIFKYEYRKQLLATISATLIALTHGIALGWLSPMLIILQSNEKTPLNFSINLSEASWVGSLICVGGIIGCVVFGLLLDRIGRKVCLYCLAVPHLCFWVLIFYARSVKYLYASRICAGITGGGCYVVLPIFLGEISNNNIRGRLTSFFPLTLNTGILLGYIISTHVEYKIIPCVCLVLPIVFLILAIFFPETPQFLLRSGKVANAEKSLRFYKNCSDNSSKTEVQKFEAEFLELQQAIASQQNSQNANVTWDDFRNKNAFKALCSGFVLMILNVFSGSFALIFYMSSVFEAAKVEVNPNTNTIIIGVVQILGTYTAIILVDRVGRKLLMIISTAGMGVGLALFGMYGFFAQETTCDLSDFNRWLPLLLMTLAIFSANIGIISVTFVLLVEVMPSKIRSRAASFCLNFYGVFGFCSVKTFPIIMDMFGLSASMWMCASVCALGLFYISVFIKETKGKSLDKDDSN